GEEWEVHGGGFYHVQKYMVAPPNMPEELTWHKWQSYTTWLSGFVLLVLIYYLGADLYLVDPNIADISTWMAISISLASIIFGWIAYDSLCKSKLGETPTLLMILLFVLLTAMAWGYTQVFTGRAALLHLGAFTATIMSANVFMIIIPNQKIVVADLKAGRKPDAKYGKIAKLRSTHNNYLTLPVIFLMLSNHYPLAFASDYNWLIASLVFLMGVTIRHYFNTMHAKKGRPNWTWLATTIIFIVIIALSTAPLYSSDPEFREEGKVSVHQERVMASANFEEVSDIVLGRCAMCHAQEPVWEGILWPPKGVRLETPADVAAHARAIYVQSAVTHAMPPANVSYMEEEERRILRDWYRNLN
ncbi:MAG: urate hydroxylase PuuD, partial [Pseudomonadota bacterium]